MTTRPAVRPPAVAGRFYPDDPVELAAAVRAYLAGGSTPGGGSPELPDAPDAPGAPGAPGADAARARPVALVAPHAGFVYSGPVAGSAYRLVAGAGARILRAVLVGPSHHVAFRGLALPASDAFDTPLGPHPVDRDGADALGAHPLVRRWERAHSAEHCLEVQLPFLRVALGPVPIVPLVTGAAEVGEVAEILDRVWDERTLVVVSTDLSHYLPWARAREADRRTADAVEHLDADALGPHDACGVVALRGLLAGARRRGLRARCVDLRSSGDTAGDRERVVGYGAFGLWARADAAPARGLTA